MQDVEVLIQLGEGSQLPVYATDEAAGMDLYSTEDFELKSLERKLVPTGLRLVIPVGFEGQIRPRSGLALKFGIGMVNAPGTIDSDYRGEIGVILINLSETVVKVGKGERIAQLVVCPVTRTRLREVPDVSVYQTTRGDGGFGSTGIK